MLSAFLDEPRDKEDESKFKKIGAAFVKTALEFVTKKFDSDTVSAGSHVFDFLNRAS